VKVTITVEDTTRDILLTVTPDETDEPRTVVLFPNEAEAIGWGLISASERSRTLWAAAAAPHASQPSAN